MIWRHQLSARWSLTGSLKRDKVIKKLSGESKKLKRELNKAQASSIELE
jgi:hypothetical protein